MVITYQKKILTNQDLEKIVDTNDEWIMARTGISRRHIARDDEYTSHLAYEAAKAAIKDAEISIDEIDMLIVCTNTPDNSFPTTANKLQSYLDLSNVPSFDLQAVCSGFIYGMQVSDSMLISRKYKTILLVCAEKMSSLIDWNDRSTAVLFGDGAGAVILQHDSSSSGIIDCKIYSDGSFYDILRTNGGVSTSKTAGTVQMDGPKVFKKAVEKMIESTSTILKSNNIRISDVDYFIPHQANIRIINSVAKKLEIDESKVVTTVENHANCSAASIPLALSELKKKQNFKKGDILVFTAFGAGLTWGALILRW